MTLSAIFQKIWRPWPYKVGEIADAESENVLRDQSHLMQRIDSVRDGARETQEKLRGAVQAMRSSSSTVLQHAPDAMAEMISGMRTGHHRK